MNKNRMMRPTVPGAQAVIAKPISIKGTGGKSGGRVSKAVELISEDLLCVTDS